MADSQQIRLFLIEDQVMWVGIFSEFLRSTGVGIELVGHVTENVDDLIDRVRASAASVVAADVLLTRMNSYKALRHLPRYDGIRAAARVRKQFGRNIKIIVYTAFPQERERAMKLARPDLFLLNINSAPIDLVGAIKAVSRGESWHEPARGSLASIQLWSDSHSCQITLTHPSEQFDCRFPPLPFVLLRYLSLACKASDNNWLVKKGPGSDWEITRPDKWQECCHRSGVSVDKPLRTIPGRVLAGLVHKINSEVNHAVPGGLVIEGQPGRPRSGEVRYRQLNDQIDAASILIDVP